MIKLAGIGASGGAVVGAVALAGVAALAYFTLRADPGVPVVEPQAAPVVARNAPEVPGPAADLSIAEPTPAPPPEPSEAPMRAPSFDIVRSEADGTTLIAGRAEPDTQVVVLLDETGIGEQRADGQGGFVAFLDIAPSNTPRILSLASERDGVIVASPQTVILAPTAEAMLASRESEPGDTPMRGAPTPGTAPKAQDRPAEPVRAATDAAVPEAASGVDPAPDADTSPPEGLVAMGPPATGTHLPEDVPSLSVGRVPAGPVAPTARETMTPTAASPDQVQVAAAPHAPVPGTQPPGFTATPDAAAPPGALPAPSAPRVLVADDTGIKVLQEPGPGPEVMGNVSLDTITYDAAGEVVLGGRGRPSGFVRVYLDNNPIHTTRIGADGQWRAELPRVDTRVYTLRVDEIEEDGDVVSRAETPFRPEAPETVVAADSSGTVPVTVVTVQPGFTLWRIARENYGRGLLYVRVFEANSDKIRDPDLIYPGQIFTVP